METNENLTEKLNYIGLDLENIPDKLNFFQTINCRIRKNFNEKNYKVYKYIDVNDIDIFLTPTDRLTDYTEKYAKALPLGAYLYTDTDKNIERNVQLLKIIKEMQIEEVEKLQEEQERLAKNIPFNIRFYKDYLWQIYYSEISNRYFMLAPIKETECTALFYVIKQQLNGSKQKIYAPICYANYSGRYLNDEELEELENYLCFFTKDWPLMYEVYDQQNSMSLQIIGKANIFDDIKSEYKIDLKNQGEAENFYKLLKALFILETQLAHHYKFTLKIDKKGMLHFNLNGKEIEYKDLAMFIKNEYVKGLEQAIKAKETKINLDKKLKNLKAYSKTLDNEYYEKEKQISTFLECKKTFFGRVKYFIKYKKVSMQTSSSKPMENDEPKTLKYCERTDIKDTYTIEELLTLYMNLDQETSSIKDFEADIEAINKRIEILQTKISNATQYIKEIDEHKKSIFEFWRFTNKDESKQLNAGEPEEHVSKKLKKVFNFEMDFENLSKQFDKLERTNLEKDEKDSVYIATTEILEDLNIIRKNEKIPIEHLDNLKKDINTSDEVYGVFDIFGSVSSSKEQLKTLGNIKHRESKKNEYVILNLKENTSIEEYEDTLKRINDNINNSFNKITNTMEIPIYKTGTLDDGLNVFYISPDTALKNRSSGETSLYKLILKENVHCIPFANIIYYNNMNQTLPLGMNVSDGVLIDKEKLNLNLKCHEQNYVLKVAEGAVKPETLKINIYEYEIC